MYNPKRDSLSIAQLSTESESEPQSRDRRSAFSEAGGEKTGILHYLSCSPWWMLGHRNRGDREREG